MFLLVLYTCRLSVYFTLRGSKISPLFVHEALLVNSNVLPSGISTQVLSRITGCIFVVPGERNNLPTEQIAKLNIGLNLKFNKKVVTVLVISMLSSIAGWPPAK